MMLTLLFTLSSVAGIQASVASGLQTTGDWYIYELADELGTYNVLAVSDWSSPHRRMDRPYDDVKARLVFDCQHLSAWIDFDGGFISRESELRIRVDGIEQEAKLGDGWTPDGTLLLNASIRGVWADAQAFEIMLPWYGYGNIRFKWNMVGAGEIMDHACQQISLQSNVPQWRIESSVDDWGDPAIAAVSRRITPLYSLDSPGDPTFISARLVVDCFPSPRPGIEFRHSNENSRTKGMGLFYYVAIDGREDIWMLLTTDTKQTDEEVHYSPNPNVHNYNRITRSWEFSSIFEISIPITKNVTQESLAYFKRSRNTNTDRRFVFNMSGSSDAISAVCEQ